MTLRVIAGSAKGRRLKQVDGDTTRPIMDRVKESLFNIIGRDILDATFLDLFAGTGSVGIEALSRGAASATFIDLERKAIEIIKQNLLTTNLGAKATVKRGDALAFLAAPSGTAYDFIFVAPPQYKGLWKEVLIALNQQPAILHRDSQIIVQIDPREQETLSLAHLQTVDERRYGNTLLWFLVVRDQRDEGASGE